MADRAGEFDDPDGHDYCVRIIFNGTEAELQKVLAILEAARLLEDVL